MLQVQELSKSYRTKAGIVDALDNVNISIETGEFVAVRGPSGCGKSTLLLAMGGMLRPSRGKVIFDGQDLYQLSGWMRNRVRAKSIGFVFQMFHLVPYLTVVENVLLGAGPGAGRSSAMALLEQLGLAHRAGHRPGELSAGEKQRTAIGRALIRNPRLILADEPTGNLDPENGAEVFTHLEAFHRQGGTVVVVTHGDDAGRFADRTIRLREGRLEGQHQRHCVC